MLQDNRIVRTLKKQIKNQCLHMLEELQSERPDDFKVFWAAFGAVLKEGLHYADDNSDKERIAKLVRFESTRGSELTSLPEYRGRMKPQQKAIYYATGTSRALLEGSPHLERLKKQDYEVLLLTDPVDPFAVSGLGEFDGKPLVSAMDASLELEDESNEDKQKQEEQSKAAEPLVERFKNVLSGRVSEVRVSSRLTESAVCLVTPDGGVAPHLEELLRAHNPNLPKTKRILEINPSHPVIESLKQAYGKNPDSADVSQWMELLYDQALIAEGSAVEDPAGFARRLGHLMQQAPLH
jgi:molecular chaperone HtpG